MTSRTETSRSTTRKASGRRLVGYVRVSSNGQLDGYGPDAQRADIRAWAKANGHRIVLWTEDAITGTCDALDRPGFAEAVEMIATKRAEGIVVARLDRLARSVTVQESALAYLWRLGASVYAVDSGEVHADDPDDPMRTFVRQVMGGIAQLDRAMTVRRLAQGRRAKAAEGKKAVGSYRVGERGTGKGRTRDAGPDAAEQRAVSRIVALRREGWSYREIAATLDQEGHKPRRAQSWSAMSVRNIAHREALAASATGGKSRQHQEGQAP